MMGFFNANPALIKAAVFPLRETSLSIHDMLSELARVDFIRLGACADGRRYGLIVKFIEHQRVNRPTPSKIKGLQIEWDGSGTISESSVSSHGPLTESSPQERKGKSKGKESTSADFNATEAAQGYCHAFSVAGQRNYDGIRDAIEVEREHFPSTPQAVAERMIAAREAFLASSPQFDGGAVWYITSGEWKKEGHRIAVLVPVSQQTRELQEQA